MLGTSVAQANSRQRRGKPARGRADEGFQPAQFTSSRDARSKQAPQRPEDFMDEGDFDAFGATLTAADHYSGARGSAVIAQSSLASARSSTLQQGGSGTVSRAIAFSPEVISAVSAPQLSVGEELLRAMRWRPRKRDAALLARQAAEVGLTASALLPKLDSGGIGYTAGSGDRWLSDRAASRRSALVRHVTATGSGAPPAATGGRALFTTDAYGQGVEDDMAQYDIAGTVEEERQLVAAAQAAPSGGGASASSGTPLAIADGTHDTQGGSTAIVPRALPNRKVCHDGAPALPGFEISMTPLHQANQPSGGVPFLVPADVPAAFKPVHTFHSAPPLPPGARADSRAGGSGRQRALTPAQRGAALGEAPPPTRPSNTPAKQGSDDHVPDSTGPASAALRSQFAPAGSAAAAGAPTAAAAKGHQATQSESAAATGQQGAATAQEFNENGHPVVPSVLFQPVFRVSEWAPHKLVCRRHNVPEPYTTQLSQGADAARQQEQERQSEATATAAALLESLAASTAGQAASASADAEAAPLPPSAPRDLLASVFQSDTESESSSDSSDSESEQEPERGSDRPSQAASAPTPAPDHGRPPLVATAAPDHSGSVPMPYPQNGTTAWVADAPGVRGPVATAAAPAPVAAPPPPQSGAALHATSAPPPPADAAVGPALPPGFQRPALPPRRHGRSPSREGGGHTRRRDAGGSGSGSGEHRERSRDRSRRHRDSKPRRHRHGGSRRSRSERDER